MKKLFLTFALLTFGGCAATTATTGNRDPRDQNRVAPFRASNDQSSFQPRELRDRPFTDHAGTEQR